MIETIEFVGNNIPPPPIKTIRSYYVISFKFRSNIGSFIKWYNSTMYYADRLEHSTIYYELETVRDKFEELMFNIENNIFEANILREDVTPYFTKETTIHRLIFGFMN